jgi:hypothetical protein
MPGGGGKGGGKKPGGGGSLPPIQIGINGAFDIDAKTDSTLNATTHSDLTANTNSVMKADTSSKLDLNAKTNSVLDTNNALRAEVDLKPFQGDLCLKLKLGLDHLPSTSVCRDSSRHFGITLFGVKVIGFDYVSGGNTVVEDLGQRPFVVGQRPGHDHHGFGANGIRISVGE